MSVDQGSDTKEIVIYVQLLDEGTVVYRPAKAVPISPNIARLLTPENYALDDEEWEFPPGSFVRYEKRMIKDGMIELAVELLDENEAALPSQEWKKKRKEYDRK